MTIEKLDSTDKEYRQLLSENFNCFMDVAKYNLYYEDKDLEITNFEKHIRSNELDAIDMLEDEIIELFTQDCDSEIMKLYQNKYIDLTVTTPLPVFYTYVSNMEKKFVDSLDRDLNESSVLLSLFTKSVLAKLQNIH